MGKCWHIADISLTVKRRTYNLDRIEAVLMSSFLCFNRRPHQPSRYTCHGSFRSTKMAQITSVLGSTNIGILSGISMHVWPLQRYELNPGGGGCLYLCPTGMCHFSGYRFRLFILERGIKIRQFFGSRLSKYVKREISLDLVIIWSNFCVLEYTFHQFLLV